MNAIILAAGEGKRLNPLTKNIPKGLVPLFGKTLLERQIDVFTECGITDISIVTGYLGNMIKFSDVKYFQNILYKNTNMIETLFCAREKLTDSVIISYGDIIFEKQILQNLLQTNDSISVVVDKSWKKYWEIRFQNPLEDAESLILDSNNYIKNIGEKVKSYDKIQGQYIGLMKFQNEGIKLLKDFYDKMKNHAKTGTNLLNSSIPFEKSYMTDLIQGMINDGCKIKAVSISNGWLELDSMNDYETYNKLHEMNLLNKFFSP